MLSLSALRVGRGPFVVAVTITSAASKVMARHRSTRYDTRQGLKEGPTLLRLFGLFMCSSLAVASVWLAGQTHAQDPDAEGNPFAKYRQPVQDDSGDAPAASPSPFAPSATSATSAGPAPSQLYRRRVADQLSQAREKLKAGDREEALRLATVAARMAHEWNVSFGPKDDSPLTLIAEIEASTTPADTGSPEAIASAAMLEQEVPESVDGKRQFAKTMLESAQADIRAQRFDLARQKIQKVQGVDVSYDIFDLRPEHVLVELARTQPARPDGPSETLVALNESTKKPAPMPSAQPKPESAPGSNPGQDELKTRANTLLSLAKEAVDRGHLTEARELALEAQQLDVTWGLFEERPEHLIADIERKTGTEIFAAKPQSAPAGGESGMEQNREKRAAALAMLEDARGLLDSGRLDDAQEMAAEVQKLDVAYELFDDRPDLLLQDIRTAQARQMIDTPGKPAEPAAPQQPAATLAAQQAQKQQALEMLGAAREAMRAGKLEVAAEKLNVAEGFDVAYGLFDDRPEVVREDLTRMIAAREAQAAETKVATAQSKAPAMSREEQKQEATRLLAAAREAMRSGDLTLAAQHASAATQFDVTYDLFEDNPETLLTEIQRARQNIAMTRPQAPATPAVETANPFATAASSNAPLDLTTPQTEETAKPRSGFGPQRDAMVVNSDAVSATELYDRGVSHLRAGDRKAAYDAFLAAYQQPAGLDPYRQQQLQDKLRELAPRRREIVQTSSETVSGTSELLPILEPNRLNAAVQEQAIKFDKLRSEALNAIFRAEKLREKRPEEALMVLDQTIESINGSDLGPEKKQTLLTSVTATRSSIDAYMQQKAPIIELERQNAETRDLIEREIETRVRVEQELASLVDKFNMLMEQRRFAEAHTVAKQAKELSPEVPEVVNMELKSLFAMRNDRIEKLKADKEVSWWEQIQDVEESVVNPLADGRPIAYPSNWSELKNRKPTPTDGREHTSTELRVKQSLANPVSLHFENAPLSQIMQHISDSQGINVVIDRQGLAEEGVTESLPISIGVDGIQLRSALNLMLHPLNLDYSIENEVLNITSRLRQQGELKTTVYQVADLVVPVTVRSQTTRFRPGTGFGNPSEASSFPSAGLQSVSSNGLPAGNGFAQVPANPIGGMNAANPAIPGLPTDDSLGGPSATNYDFDSLTTLITTTVSPDSWDEFTGQGTMHRHESTLSLVIRQTQKVHQEIADLLDQLRRLQDLQVTIEVRFITVSDQFFEQIGIDFDFNVNDTVGGPFTDDDFNPIRPFGQTDPVNGATGGGQAGQAGQAGQGGQQGQQQGSTLSGLAPFGAQPTLNIMGRDSWPGTTVVGLVNGTDQFSPELDIPFRQGSFDLAAPQFGGFDATAGLQFGLAILSDIEAFMFVRAAQGDRRSNIMFAPKLTLFNGGVGTVQAQAQRPFVVALIPVASAFNIGFQPIIQTIPDGTSLTVRAVVSADRRYVRLSVLPVFSSITDVFTFSFISGGNIGGGGGGQFGGGGGGGQFGGGGGGGGGQFGGGGGGGGQNQQGNQGAVGNVTVQQPVVDIVTVDTVVSVPDGGTVLLGGVKTLREGRNMAGVPILNKIPYISRLFKNTGVGRETESLMLMVTPRIIIQEEEEDLLGIAN